MKEAIILALEESMEKIQKKDSQIEKMGVEYDSLANDCKWIFGVTVVRFRREKGFVWTDQEIQGKTVGQCRETRAGKPKGYCKTVKKFPGQPLLRFFG